MKMTDLARTAVVGPTASAAQRRGRLMPKRPAPAERSSCRREGLPCGSRMVSICRSPRNLDEPKSCEQLQNRSAAVHDRYRAAFQVREAQFRIDSQGVVDGGGQVL